MKVDKVDLTDTGSFSPLFLDYMHKKESLKPFYQTFPSLKDFEGIIQERNFPDKSRHVLVDVLNEQYGPLVKTDAVDFNIHSLENPNTYTVTTGHQLNIFTGPLYFIYKIVSTINTCKALREKYPKYNFVPVYWMASEDHDAAEISYFHLFGKKYEWDTPQTGAVGKFKPHSLNDIIAELPEAIPLFEQAYLDHDTLAEAVRFYVNELFGEEGLVVLDADDHRLKELFAPVIEEELFEHTSNKLVETSSEKLEAAGYKEQAFSREINFFYMENGTRERIIQEGDQFKVLNTDKTFSPDEMKALLNDHPEVFSPNVIMRPVYQETILPNLAYIGGPAEVAYWLQLKEVFDHYQVPFPALMPRNFAMVVTKTNHKKLKKLGMTSLDIFKPADQLKEEYLAQHGENGLVKLEEERKEIAQIFEQIKKKAETIDGSLGGFIGAEGAKSFKSLENISKRLKKAEEQNNETAMSQIDGIKDKLFPEGTLQERHENFLNFYLNHPGFIEDLLKKLDPFDFRFHVLYDI